MSTDTDDKLVVTEVRAGELLADTDKDLVGSSVMISYSRKGRYETMQPRGNWRGRRWPAGASGCEQQDTDAAHFELQ